MIYIKGAGRIAYVKVSAPARRNNKMETDLSDYLTLLKDANHLNYQYLSTIIKKFKNVDR